ncbi:penicillin-binding protein, 1A family [Desulfofarcimen acetoxidans DSM 771]|uniref:Penicillin-binding protein 1A n=1 Tax=Desulfofarcimen acetoxidans (strain ATCC 49208 / DSM 771 / KCTC 5769 / VKM B-1644 / 5575) TaxID=485916 RepID=C8W693_DESAS|nr:penicillin-binding protein, 1A family [Desulfofarcimen acetoxidans DSM 771]
MLKKISAILIILSLVFMSGCSVLKSLPEPEIPVASKIYDVNGQLITTVYRQNRNPVTMNEISPHVQDAIVAVEDSRFYRHHGLDFLGMLRALYRNLLAGGVVEGGSTITQQLAKNLYLGNERTFSRKLKEMVYAVQLERSFSKKEILQMYLNTIYFGQGAYGIEAASRYYFDTPAKDLDLAEGAMLAGIPRSPENYSPANDWDAAKKRQTVVLDRMAELNYISTEQAAAAKNEPLIPVKEKKWNQKAPYFIAEVVNYFKEHYPQNWEMIFTQGLSIYTTLDVKLQDSAEKAVQSNLAKSPPDLECALVALDPHNGYIKAMVGGRDFNRSQYNRVYARSQPGSAFKPFLYAAAIDAGYTAATTIKCEPTVYRLDTGENYIPKDYHGNYHYRPMTLKEALYISDNVVSVNLNNQIGPAVLASYAAKMGIDSPLRSYLSLVLGTSEVTPIEMARAYGPLANNGIKTKPFFILRVTDRYGRVLENNRPFQEQAIDPKSAYIVTDMLKSVLYPGGTAPQVAGIINRPAAGKTGTTEDLKDAWFVGYTPDIVAAVYTGYDDKNKKAGNTGGVIAAPIWADFIREGLKGQETNEFTVPDGIVFTDICPEDGLLAAPGDPRAIHAAFIKGTEPKTPCYSLLQDNLIQLPDNPEIRP